MVIQSHASRIEFKKAFFGFVSLLGSSVISAIGFVVIASNRWISFDQACGIFIILFVQWQTLGLTIAKTGIEQVVFAMVTDNENTFLDPAKYIRKKALPLSAVFSLVVLLVFSPWAAIVAFGTILLDTWSLIIMADLNARKRFKTTALSNLLNYPLFFVIICVVNHVGRLTIAVTLSVFLLSSAVRWLWLKSNQFIQTDMQEVFCNVNIEMGIQQTLNYLLFRADQIVLAVMGLKTQSIEGVAMYVFMAKFPELVSGVVVIAGVVLFPRTYIKYPFAHPVLFAQLKKHAFILSGYIASVAFAIIIYINLWNGQIIPFNLALPFLIHAICILLVNNITYSTLRQGYLQRLLQNLSFSVLIGFLISVVVHYDFSVRLLSWIVPIQLMIFITLTFVLNWGRSRELYV